MELSRDRLLAHESLARFATDWKGRRVDCPFAFGFAEALGAVAKW
jgi:hypothetical protein